MKDNLSDKLERRKKRRAIVKKNKYKNNNKCIRCDKLIQNISERCRSCSKIINGNSTRYLRKKAPRPKPERCEICDIRGENTARGLYYDHDHTTGRFRGWICSNCNFSLGHAKDSIKILELMIEYLKKSNV